MGLLVASDFHFYQSSAIILAVSHVSHFHCCKSPFFYIRPYHASFILWSQLSKPFFTLRSQYQSCFLPYGVNIKAVCDKDSYVILNSLASVSVAVIFFFFFKQGNGVTGPMHQPLSHLL